MKNILIIIQIDFLKAGNQTLINTVRGYIRNGFFVHLLTCNKAGNSEYYQYEELDSEIQSGLKIYRFQTVASRIRFKKKRSTLSKDTKAITRKTNDIVDFSSRHINIQQYITMMSFVLGGYKCAMDIISKNKIDILYGYELYGAILANKIHKHVPNAVFVTRFQGTYLYPYLNNKHLRFQMPAQYHSIKIKSDIIIMTNDGTRGDIVCKQLNSDTKFMFLINGLSDHIHLDDNVNRKEVLRKYNINEKKNVLLASSRLVDWKRVDRIIKIASTLKSKLMNDDFVCLIAGYGNEYEALNNMIEQHNLQSCVYMLGKVDREDLNDLYNISDIVLSFFDLSNFSNTIIEAVACGRPVITINDGSTDELLRNNYNSILINNDQYLIKNASLEIHQLLINEKRLEQLKQNAYNSRKLVKSWDERMKMEVEAVLNARRLDS